MKSNFNKTDLRNVVNELLKNQSLITTLEIKKQLRNEGFQAYQNDVSKMMDDSYEEFGLDFTPNGIYREYEKSKIKSSHDTVGANSSGFKHLLANDNNIKVVMINYKRRDGEHVNSLYSPTSDCWVAYSNILSDIAYFPKIYTREMVRQAYANHFNIAFLNARCKTH